MLCNAQVHRTTKWWIRYTTKFDKIRLNICGAKYIITWSLLSRIIGYLLPQETGERFEAYAPPHSKRAEKQTAHGRRFTGWNAVRRSEFQKFLPSSTICGELCGTRLSRTKNTSHACSGGTLGRRLFPCSRGLNMYSLFSFFFSHVPWMNSGPPEKRKRNTIFMFLPRTRLKRAQFKCWQKLIENNEKRIIIIRKIPFL